MLVNYLLTDFRLSDHLLSEIIPPKLAEENLVVQWVTTALNLAGNASPRDSISLMHMSTTMGRLVMWAFTSVVRSQLYTFLTCFKSGLQSFGTILEHCLWTFKPQSKEWGKEKFIIIFRILSILECLFWQDTPTWIRFKRGLASSLQNGGNILLIL